MHVRNMFPGIMRSTQPLLQVRQGGLISTVAGSSSSSSSSRRASCSRGRALPAPWLLLLCVVGGYWLGCKHSRVVPYQVDKTAFLQPPTGLQQHAAADTHHAAAAAAAGSAPAGVAAAGAGGGVHPPSTHPQVADGGSSSSSSSDSTKQQQLQQHLLVDAQAQQLLSSSQLPLLRPPLTPGRSGDAFYTAAPYQILSWYPRIVLFPNFLSAPQRQHIIALAAHQLAPSELGVVNAPFHPGAGRTDGQQVRSSRGAFLDRSADPSGFLAHLEARIAAVTLIPPSHGEDFNVLNYKRGQHYNSHMDTFDPQFLARSNPAFGQRMATFLMYLSDVQEGGETVFKLEGKHGALRSVADRTSCGAADFKVRPRAGDAVLFWSLNHDLTVDPRALHGACPVARGEKWVMTKWLHDKPITQWEGEAL